MIKYIITTTINPPTDAIYKFLSRTDWHMIVVGDTKTPHDEFKKLELQFPNLTYMDCELQEKLYVRNDIQEVEIYDCVTSVFDPLSATNNNYLWHRGFPIQLIDKKNDIKLMGRNYTHIDVQADLWDGDPDKDAFERIAWKPCVKFTVEIPYMGLAISPFNSQNTFLSRDCFPDYCVLPFVGRMDDIFGSYI